VAAQVDTHRFRLHGRSEATTAVSFTARLPGQARAVAGPESGRSHSCGLVVKVNDRVLHTDEVVGFAFRQPMVVVDLALLRGPVTGLWRLPRTLDSSALQSRDLADPLARQLAYEVVLREAGDEREVTPWVDRDELLRLWPRLYLPRQVRVSWEEQHAVLREIGAGPDVPHANQAATPVAAGSGLPVNG